MSVNDWNNLGRDVKNIVQNAIDTGDFGRLNRDLGQTLESALGNVAQSMKNAGNMAGQYYRNQKQQEEPKPYGPVSYTHLDVYKRQSYMRETPFLPML